MRVITSKDVPERKPFNCKGSEVIITSEYQDKVKVIDSKAGTYTVEKEAVETSRVNTQEYIQSFADDVGIENILKKFALVNDPELLQQVKRPTVPIGEDGKEVVQDYTGLPSDEAAAMALAKKAQAEYSKLPQELVKGRSFNEFAETCTKEELLAYIQGLSSKKEGE